jgi:hypothetical protein
VTLCVSGTFECAFRPEEELMKRWRLALVMVLATTSWSAAAAHPKYSFTRIADDTGPIGEIGVEPVANDAGQVAFVANLNPDKPAVLVATVADASSIFRSFGFADFSNRQKPTHGFPAISGLGQVIFGALRADSVSGIFAELRSRTFCVSRASSRHSGRREAPDDRRADVNAVLLARAMGRTLVYWSDARLEGRRCARTRVGMAGRIGRLSCGRVERRTPLAGRRSIGRSPCAARGGRA